MKRWLIKLNDGVGTVDAPPEKAISLSAAQETAQQWVLGKSWRSAEIVSLRTGKVRMRYWYDGRMQYMEF